MKSKLKDFNKVKNYIGNIKKFNFYEYLYYYGISSVVRNIKKHDLISLIDICNNSCGKYADAIEFSQNVAEAVLVDKYISIEDLKKVPSEDLYDMFFEDKLFNLVNYSSKKNNKTKVENKIEPYVVKIGFDCDKCEKEGSMIIGEGCIYYYATKEDYDSSTEYGIANFVFSYDINKEEIKHLAYSDEDVKTRIERNDDDFIDNIKINLLPQLETRDSIEKEMDIL